MIYGEKQNMCPTSLYTQSSRFDACQIYDAPAATKLLHVSRPRRAYCFNAVVHFRTKANLLAALSIQTEPYYVPCKIVLIAHPPKNN
eukprot:1161289-Pelagomonas_calceolata.AAC.6